MTYQDQPMPQYGVVNPVASPVDYSRRAIDVPQSAPAPAPAPAPTPSSAPAYLKDFSIWAANNQGATPEQGQQAIDYYYRSSGGTPASGGGLTAPTAPSAPMVPKAAGTSPIGGISSASAPQGSLSTSGNSASGIAGGVDPNETEAERIMRLQVESAGPVPQTADEIAQKEITANQDQVNNINQNYNNQLVDQGRVNDMRSAETNAMSVLNGLTGSSEASNRGVQTANFNNQENKKIQDQKALALSTLYSAIRRDAKAEALQQAKDYRTNATTALGAIKERKDAYNTKMLSRITMLGKGGMTVEGLKTTDPKTYQDAVNAAGGEAELKQLLFAAHSNTAIGSPTIVGGKIIQYYQKPDGSHVAEVIDAPAGVDLSPDAKIEKLGDNMYVSNDKGKSWQLAIAGQPDQLKQLQIQKAQMELQGEKAVDPATLQGMLNVYKSTGTLPSFGLGGKSPLRAQFYAALGGADGSQVVADAATNKAARAGVTTALRTQENQYAANQTSIGTLDKQLTLAKKYSDQVNRAGSPLIAKYQLAIKNNVFGDPDTATLHNLVKTASYEFAKILSGSSASIAGVTVSSAADAEGMLNEAMGRGQFNQILDVMKQESDFRLKSQADTIAGLKKDSQNIGSIVKEAATNGQTVKSNGQDYVVGQVYNDGVANWTVDANGNWSKQ